MHFQEGRRLTSLHLPTYDIGTHLNQNPIAGTWEPLSLSHRACKPLLQASKV